VFWLGDGKEESNMFRVYEHIPNEQSRLEALYNQHVHSLWHVAKSYVKDDQLAEDMVHDAFYKLVKAPELLDRIPDRSAKAFLATVVKHQSIDYLRKKKRRLEEVYGDYIESDQSPIECMPLERMIQNEAIEHICGMLKSLPEAFRIPLELRMLYGFSNQEIADILNITKNLAAVRLNRGRNKLLQALKK